MFVINKIHEPKTLCTYILSAKELARSFYTSTPNLTADMATRCHVGNGSYRGAKPRTSVYGSEMLYEKKDQNMKEKMHPITLALPCLSRLMARTQVLSISVSCKRWWGARHSARLERAAYYSPQHSDGHAKRRPGAANHPYVLYSTRAPRDPLSLLRGTDRWLRSSAKDATRSSGPPALSRIPPRSTGGSCSCMSELDARLSCCVNSLRVRLGRCVWTLESHVTHYRYRSSAPVGLVALPPVRT